MVRYLIVVTGHFERKKVKRIASQASMLLHRFGTECIAADIKRKKFNSRNAEAVVAVGGDGTLLRVVREMKHAAPIIGVAAGEHCALMQVKPRKMRSAMQKIAEGEFTVQHRMRLQALADGVKLPLALNEVMLVNRLSSAIISYCVDVGGKEAYCAKADGCIIATPTGSSGHAYSAGGKRLAPGSKKIAIVPSNSMNRKGTPCYAGGNSRVVLSGFDSKRSYEVVVDGQPRFPVKKKLIIRGGKDALFLKT